MKVGERDITQGCHIGLALSTESCLPGSTRRSCQFSHSLSREVVSVSDGASQ